MPGFNLPETQLTNTAAFFDMPSATAWLAGQPQANAPAMLAELLIQIEAFNAFRVTPRERFKTMEVLRKPLFAVSGECQRRYENKPLPLLPSEQTMLEWTRRLWRTCAVAYLHCLQACLEKDSALAGESARVVHRVLSCLRMEQISAYLGGAQPGSEFWTLLHAVWMAAETLGVTHDPVVDRLLGETSESTVSGQYCMALLLHLADPFSLSRSQFAAACRWFARWRELAKVLPKPDERPKSCCILLDLVQGQLISEVNEASTEGRWLSVGSVLRKMNQRLELLASGEMPEMLKLGSGLSSDACVLLLNQLEDRLKSPLSPIADAPAETVSAGVAVGLENIHSLLGGKGLKDKIDSISYGSKLSAEQIAVFGHVVRQQEEGAKAENWRVVGQASGVLHLLRPLGSGEPRLAFRNLLAVKVPQLEHFALASVTRLSTPNGTGRNVAKTAELCVSATLFPGEPSPLVAEIREKPAGKVSNHPAFLLPGDQARPPSVVLPAGLPARALSIRFFEASEQRLLDLRLAELSERGGNYELWSCTRAGAGSELTLASE